MKRNVEDMGDEEAAEAVAAFEIKYNRLKERYKVRVYTAHGARKHVASCPVCMVGGLCICCVTLDI